MAIRRGSAVDNRQFSGPAGVRDVALDAPTKAKADAHMPKTGTSKAMGVTWAAGCCESSQFYTPNPNSVLPTACQRTEAQVRALESQLANAKTYYRDLTGRDWSSDR